VVRLWVRSSRCDSNGCVEVGADWVRSSRSGDTDQCVEVRRPHDSVVYVRDSKDPGGPILRFSAAEWTAFVAGARAGEFDLQD
jgi:hypothetical protein